MIEQVGPEARLREVGDGVSALGRLARDLPQLLRNAENISTMLADGGLRLHPDTTRAIADSPDRAHAPRAHRAVDHRGERTGDIGGGADLGLIYDIDIIYHRPMSRFLVDLTEKQKAALERLGAKEKRSRASLIREAIDVLVQSRKKKKSALDATFGLWGDRAIDGVEYQRKIRSEW